MSLKEMKTDGPMLDIFPSTWEEQLSGEKIDNLCFRNLEHFKYVVSKIKQKDDHSCGVSYSSALDTLVKGNMEVDQGEVTQIQNLVKENLHKMGLLTTEIYERYEYTTDGTAVGYDVGKYAAGEPDCVMTPAKEYIDFFYELYISISYPHQVSNETVMRNVYKLLATIEQLERRHIFIKITLVFPASGTMCTESRNFFSSIPLFSHKDAKDVQKMVSVVNDRLLRKFYFAVLENFYGSKIACGLGTPVELQDCMNIGGEFNEIEFYTNVVEVTGAGELR